MKKVILFIVCLWSIEGYGQDLPYKALGESAKRIPISDSTSLFGDSLKTMTSRAISNDMSNPFNTRTTLLHFWKKLLAGSFYTGKTQMTRGIVSLKLAGFGDSMGDLLAIPIYQRLLGILGIGGGGPYTVITTSGSASTHNNVAENTYWPTGIWYEINGTGNLTFANTSGSLLSCSQIKIYYIKESGAGSFQVLLDSANTGYTNYGSVVDCNNATTESGVITINKPYGGWRVRISQVSGNVKVLNVYGFATDRDGIAYIPVNNPGLNWVNANTTSRAITNPVFADLGIDLALFHAKENGNIYSTIKSFLTDFKAVSPNTDWILVGSAPNADIGDYTNANTLRDNKSFQRIAYEDTFMFYDAYKVFRNFQNIYRLGWAGDSIHLANAAWIYAGSMLNDIIGINRVPTLLPAIASDVDESVMIQETRKLKFKSGNVFLGGMGLNQSGINWFSSGNHIISDTTGTTLGMFNGAGGVQGGGFKISANLNNWGYNWAVTGSPGYYRDGSGDLAIYSHKGNGTLATLRGGALKIQNSIVVSTGTIAPTNSSIGIEINNSNQYLRLVGGPYSGLAGLTGVYGGAYYVIDSNGFYHHNGTAWKRVRYTDEMQLVVPPVAAGDSSSKIPPTSFVDKIKDSLLSLQGGDEYTPTLTAGTNVTAVVGLAQNLGGWSKSGGKMITMYGTATVSITSANTPTTFYVSLPVVSDFGTGGPAGPLGFRASGTVTGYKQSSPASPASGWASPDNSNDRVTISFVPTETGDQQISWSVIYKLW